MGLQHEQDKQLCWRCSYSCNEHKCLWVRTLKRYYKGTIIDDDGYIIECLKFKKDNSCFSTRDKADALGISLVMYYNYKYMLKKANLKMSVEDYVTGLREKQKQKKLSFDRKQYDRLYYAKVQIKKFNLNITPQEFIKRLDKKKKK